MSTRNSIDQICMICRSGDGGQWIQCGRCSQWTHRVCLKDGKVYNDFANMEFFCIDCYSITNAFKRITDTNYSVQSANNELALLQVHGVALPQRKECTEGEQCMKSQEILEYFAPQTAALYQAIAVGADGNCMYRAACKALYSDEEHHLQLRLRSLCEVVLHTQHYDQESEGGRIEQNTIRQTLEEIGSPGAWQGITAIYAVSAVCKTAINTYLPTTNVAASVYTRTVRSRETNHGEPISLMFSDLGFKPERQYRTNHFVPLINRKNMRVLERAEPVIVIADDVGLLKDPSRDSMSTGSIVKELADKSKNRHLHRNNESIPLRDLEEPNESVVIEKPRDFEESSEEEYNEFPADRREESPVPEFRILKGASKRGKDVCIEKSGFSYTIKRVNNIGFTTWKCSRYPACLVMIRQGPDGEFLERNKTHIHESNPLEYEDRQFRKEMKDTAKNEPKLKADDVWRSTKAALEKKKVAVTVSAKKRTACRQVIDRIRKQYPAPKDLGFNLEDQLDEDTSAELIFEDIRVDEARHIVITSPDQLKTLKTRRQWFCDGTFKVVSLPFKQLWTIHGFIRQGKAMTQVPLVYCIMSRRQAKDYIQVFTYLIKKLGELKLERINMDFEAAVWAAARQVFGPQLQRAGCHFHYRQRILKRVKRIPGWFTKYRKHEQTRLFVQLVVGLALLPPNLMREGLEWLRSMATTQEAKELIAFYEEYWICRWTPGGVSVYGRQIRTNNDVEGFHNKLNRMAGGKLSFSNLVNLIKESINDFGDAKDHILRGVTERRRRAKYIRIDRKFTTAEKNFQESGEWKDLVRFGANNAKSLSIMPLSDCSSDDDDDI